MKKGILVTCCFDDIDEYEKRYNFDIRLHITRSRKKGMYSNFIYVPELAPSEKLFTLTQYKWKKFIFSTEEMYYLKSVNAGDWHKLYERDFLKELNEDGVKRRYIKRVCQRLDEGKNILMVCYCKNKDVCHRKYLAEHIEELGYKVIIR